MGIYDKNENRNNAFKYGRIFQILVDVHSRISNLDFINYHDSNDSFNSSMANIKKNE